VSRPVTIATISLDLPPGPQTVEGNLRRAMSAVDEAGRSRPDIICLPEMYAILGVEEYGRAVKLAADMSPRIESEISSRARTWGAYIISCTVERADDALYNTAFLFDRSGRKIGRYRKTHLAPGEEATFTPWEGYPIFELDFGRVAVMICMDIHYSEVARIYALQGADILFWPTMAYGPTGEFLEVLFRSRAMDNQIYCVTANFCQQPYLAGKVMGRAYIVGPDGKIRADTGHRAGVAVATVDLDEGYEYWAARPDLRTLKDVFLGLRRPETYGMLTQPQPENPPWRIAEPKLSPAVREMIAEREKGQNEGDDG